MNKLGILIMSFWAILTPILPLMIVVSIFIGLDVATGIWKSLKNGKKIRSTILAHTISKGVLYNTAILSAFLMETYIFGGIPVVKLVGGFIATVEFKSILENIGEITGIDIWKHVAKYFVKKSENNIESKIKKD